MALPVPVPVPDSSADPKRQQLQALRGLLRSYEKRTGIGEGPLVLPTGCARLDAWLPTRGWPAGEITELVGPAGGGRLSVPLLAVGAAAQRFQWCALVDGEGCFYPPGAARFGVPLSHLCVVRPPQGRRAAWAAEQMARSRCFGLVLLLPRHPIAEAQARRLRQAAEAGRCAVLVVAPKGSTLPAALRLSVEPEVAGAGPRVGPYRERDELRVRVGLLRSRSGGALRPLRGLVLGPQDAPAPDPLALE